MNNICVYCGSKAGQRPEYIQAARQLGQLLAQRNLGLVYGGASIGLMGEVATAALEAGGHVTGIIPHVLVEQEIVHPGLNELITVNDMHERKAKMAAISQGFIALPGGLGTLEEVFEMLTWGQMALHQKPVGLINVSGFYDGLLGFLDHTVDEGFLWPDQRAQVLVDRSVEALLDVVVAQFHKH